MSTSRKNRRIIHACLGLEKIYRNGSTCCGIRVEPADTGHGWGTTLFPSEITCELCLAKMGRGKRKSRGVKEDKKKNSVKSRFELVLEAIK